MQRTLALQNPYPGALHLESTLTQGQMMTKTEQRAWAPAPYVCAYVHTWLSGSHSHKASLCAFNKTDAPPGCAYVFIPMHKVTQPFSLSLWTCTVSSTFFRSHVRVCMCWLSGWGLTRLGQPVYMGTHVHEHIGGWYSKGIFLPFHSSSKL